MDVYSSVVAFMCLKRASSGSEYFIAHSLIMLILTDIFHIIHIIRAGLKLGGKINIYGKDMGRKPCVCVYKHASTLGREGYLGACSMF